MGRVFCFIHGHPSRKFIKASHAGQSEQAEGAPAAAHQPTATRMRQFFIGIGRLKAPAKE